MNNMETMPKAEAAEDMLMMEFSKSSEEIEKDFWKLKVTADSLAKELGEDNHDVADLRATLANMVTSYKRTRQNETKASQN